jgi:hypothetical protein
LTPGAARGAAPRHPSPGGRPPHPSYGSRPGPPPAPAALAGDVHPRLADGGRRARHGDGRAVRHGPPAHRGGVRLPHRPRGRAGAGSRHG